MPHQRPQQRDVGHDAENRELAERAVGSRERRRAGLRAHDQLGEQRVVVDADRVALADAAVHADAGPARLAIQQDGAGLRQKSVRGILGVHAQLDRVAALGQPVGRKRQGLPGSDQQLRAHEVEAGDQFRHRVLDLQARVHLEEEEPGRFGVAALDEELDRAGVLIAARACGRDGGLAHPRAQRPASSPATDSPRGPSDAGAGPSTRARTARRSRHARRRRSVSRHGGDARPGVPRRACRCQTHASASRRAACTACRASSPSRDDAHADATAAARRLDQGRTADALERRQHGLVGLLRRRVSRHDGHTRRLHQASRADLRSHRDHRRRRRADEDHAGVRAGLGKRRVLGEEPVPWMNGLGAAGSRAPRGSGRCAGNSPTGPPAPGAPPRRPRARDGCARRHRNRPPPCECPSRGTSASRGSQSRRDWRSGPSRTSVLATIGHRAVAPSRHRDCALRTRTSLTTSALLFSRNARIPSCPSGEARRSAMASRTASRPRWPTAWRTRRSDAWPR